MSYNKIIVIGNLGADPVQRQVGENSVVNFNVAVSETRGGEALTTWYRVNAWNKLGELCQTYLAKGSKVYVEGRHSTSEFKDKEGNTRFTNEIRLADIQFLSPKSENQSSENKQAVDDDSSEEIPF